MKICHLADTHLGAGGNHPKRDSSGLTLRQEDIIDAFVGAIGRIIEIRPDVCIHAGDLFDNVRPINKIIAIAGLQLHRLAELHGVPTVIISGNHDTPKQPHIGAALDIFRQIDNLYVSAGVGLEIFEIGNCKFFALPHCLTTELQKEELKKCVPDSAARHNILIVHGVASGMPEFSMADLGEQELPVEVFKRFEYGAMGHYHNYTQVAPRAFYAGSTERLSQAERGVAKGFIEVDLEPFSVKFHEVPSREMVEIETIDAAGKRGDELVSIIRQKLDEVDASDKIVRVNVEKISSETMKTIPAEILAELKQKSFALNIRFEREKTEDETGQFGRSAIGRLQSTSKVLTVIACCRRR
jgi:DNA repair exonuclease SbcCD nuclease subunit